MRPGWFDPALFPFESRFLDVGGGRVHYVDEGEGPVLLMLHGNPTWSFFFRDLITDLRSRFRCVAVDYPGFGLSTAAPGYGFRIHEHVAVVEQVVERLDLNDVTPVVQDWGGPIGMAVAVRHPDRMRAFVVANTWAWPMTATSGRLFSFVLGGPLGHLLVRRLDVFARVFVPAQHRRRSLTAAERRMYEGPHPTPSSRRPVHVMPREIVAARPLLEEVEAGLPRLATRPALILWGTDDPAFRDDVRHRWERVFPDHHTVLLEGVGHYLWDDAPQEITAAIREWHPAAR